MTDTLRIPDELDVDSREHFVFDEADWAFYEHVLKKVGERRIFVTFDGERLEVMSPSPEHETYAASIEYLIRLLMTELRIPYRSLGSFTMKNRKADRGLEPDRCFYTRNEPAIRGKRRIDLRKDPPPDLAVEIEVSRRILDRVDVYRRLRVPELWCYDGRRLRILQLGTGGKYREVPRSPTVRDLAPEDVHRLLQRAWEVDDLTWAEEVRAWVRKHLAHPNQD